MDELLSTLAPHLLELIAAILTIIIGWFAAQARARWGIEIEARHREALHSALMTGVRRSLIAGLSREQILQGALQYVRTSVPDAVRALVRDDGILRALAEAKLRELLEATGPARRGLQ